MRETGHRVKRQVILRSYSIFRGVLFVAGRKGVPSLKFIIHVPVNTSIKITHKPDHSATPHLAHGCDILFFVVLYTGWHLMMVRSPARSSSTRQPPRWGVLLVRRWAGRRSVVATVHVLRGLDAGRLLTVIPISLSVMAIGRLVAIVHGVRLRRRSICWRRLIVGLRGVVIVLSAGCHPTGAIHRRVPSTTTATRVYTAVIMLALASEVCVQRPRG